MSDLEQANEDLQMGAYAQQVINNPAYKNAMLAIRHEHLKRFERASYQDIEELKEIKRGMESVEDFQNELETLMQGGRIAEHKLNRN